MYVDIGECHMAKLIGCKKNCPKSNVSKLACPMVPIPPQEQNVRRIVLYVVYDKKLFGDNKKCGSGWWG